MEPPTKPSGVEDWNAYTAAAEERRARFKAFCGS